MMVGAYVYRDLILGTVYYYDESVYLSVVTISMSEESYSVSESEGLVRVCVELEGEVRLSDGQMVQVLFFTQGNTATQNGEERCAVFITLNNRLISTLSLTHMCTHTHTHSHS